MSRAANVLDDLGRPSYLRLGGSSLPSLRGLATGLARLDDLLHGGFPRGRITELAGRPSAGRTALALHATATATRRGETVAWIDPADRLDPEGLTGAGTQLARVLWVRPRSARDALRAADLLLRTGGFGLVLLDLDAGNVVRAPGAWARLRQAAEHARAVLLIWGTTRITDSGASLILDLAPQRVHWRGGAGRRRLLHGFDTHLRVVRNRQHRPSAPAQLSWRA